MNKAVQHGVRSGCRLIPPEDGGIGGLPATPLRAAKIRARADAAVAKH